MISRTPEKNLKNNTETARLNAGQFEAVHVFNGPALILAGPGSGKTKVITERIKFLTEEKNISPESILVLTFSRAAAAEMKERYLKLSGKSFSSVTFGTFHSVFFAFLRSFPKYQNLKVAERSDQITALTGAMFHRFGKNRYTADLLNLVLDDIGRIKNGFPARLEETKELYGLYNEELRAKGFLDYDDMLLYAYRELASDRRRLEGLKKRYAYFLIDEFQDINRVQYETIRLMAKPENNLFCVGDDDQSIYAFRGSDPAFMRKMPEDFSGTNVMELKTNYRSTGQIVSITKRLIGHNCFRYQKQPEAYMKKGPDPVIAKFHSPKEEAEYITQKAAMLRNGETAAVLCRTNRAMWDIKDLISEEMSKRICFHTFHTSKGLEFDCVFVAACNDEVTPGQRISDEKELEEERRTFYVAATRAKTMLYFLYTEIYKDKESKPSRFLKELISR